MDQVVGRHRFDLQARHGFHLAIGHHHTAGHLVGGASVKTITVFAGLAQNLQSLGVKVVTVIMGEQDQIGLRELGEISLLPHRIHMDDLTAKGEHQCTMPDEGDREIPRPGLDDILLKFPLGVHDAGPHHQQNTHHQA